MFAAAPSFDPLIMKCGADHPWGHFGQVKGRVHCQGKCFWSAAQSKRPIPLLGGGSAWLHGGVSPGAAHTAATISAAIFVFWWVSESWPGPPAALFDLRVEITAPVWRPPLKANRRRSSVVFLTPGHFFFFAKCCCGRLARASLSNNLVFQGRRFSSLINVLYYLWRAFFFLPRSCLTTIHFECKLLPKAFIAQKPSNSLTCSKYEKREVGCIRNRLW